MQLLEHQPLTERLALLELTMVLFQGQPPLQLHIQLQACSRHQDWEQVASAGLQGLTMELQELLHSQPLILEDISQHLEPLQPLQPRQPQELPASQDIHHSITGNYELYLYLNSQLFILTISTFTSFIFNTSIIPYTLYTIHIKSHLYHFYTSLLFKHLCNN